eukprot:m.215595 g.215595  ORF g.215595 m.215595 type:complete len:132 (-) comp16978_c0_seq6:338-733(-)
MCPSHHFDHQLSAVYWRAVIFIISCVFSNCWTQISDFGTTGLASHLSGTNSVHADVAGQTLFTTSAIGTVCWTAPEILRNEPYGLEVDVFSFGIVMYEVWHGMMVPAPRHGKIKGHSLFLYSDSTLSRITH